MMGREDKAKGETLGKKKKIFFGEHYFQKRTVLLVFGWEDCTIGFCLRRLLEDCYSGALVAWNFGLRGQETVRNPRAREPDRMFLAG